MSARAGRGEGVARGLQRVRPGATIFKEFCMLRHSNRPAVARSALASASLLALALGVSALPQATAAWPVGQEDSVSLDDFTTTSKDGAKITIKHADFKGTNLTKDEIVKLLTPDTPDEEKNALVQKLKVAEISIPAIDVVPKDGGELHIRDVSGKDIDSGKIGALSIASIDGGGTDKDGPIAIKSGAIIIEDADLSDTLGAAKDPSNMSPPTHLGHFSWVGLDMTVPDKDAGGKPMHITMGSIEDRNSYDGAVLKQGELIVKNLVIEPAAGSEFANNIGILGYKSVQLSAHVAAHYDAGGKKFTLDDFTLDGANAGAIGLKAVLTDIDPALFGADANARMAAVTGGGVSAVEVKFANAGLFEKSVAFFAGQQKLTPDAIKKQWAAAAGQMLPAVLGGDPSALKIAAEAQKFIQAPTNLTVVVKPKSGSLKFADAMSGGDPTALISTLDIVATANK
jgi:hypothetical protein